MTIFKKKKERKKEYRICFLFVFCNRFYPSQAQAIADQILQDYFNDKEYDEEVTQSWSMDVCNAIRKKVVGLFSFFLFPYFLSTSEDLNIPRYKIIVQATVGEIKDHGVRVTSRCLWNTDTDNFASASFTNVLPLSISFFVRVIFFFIHSYRLVYGFLS